MSSDIVSLDTVLARQAGVVTRDQALAAGLGRSTIDERVRSRHWVPLHPCVYLVGNRLLTDEVRVRGALLWAGESAFLSGCAAAWWHGMLAEPPPTVAVTIGRSRRLRSHADVAVRRRVVPGPDRAVHRGVRVTGRPLSVLDAAIELGTAADRFLDDVLRHAVPFADVHAAHCRVFGAAGSVAGGLLAAAARRARATARDELLALLRGSGASGWAPDADVAGQTVDAAFPAARVAVVAVGWTEPPPTGPDDAGWPGLDGRGWVVLRFPGHDVVERPRTVLAEIAHHVAHGMTRLGRSC